jgi:hypothetical protein
LRTHATNTFTVSSTERKASSETSDSGFGDELFTTTAGRHDREGALSWGVRKVPSLFLPPFPFDLPPWFVSLSGLPLGGQNLVLDLGPAIGIAGPSTDLGNGRRNASACNRGGPGNVGGVD